MPTAGVKLIQMLSSANLNLVRDKKTSRDSYQLYLMGCMVEIQGTELIRSLTVLLQRGESDRTPSTLS